MMDLALLRKLRRDGGHYEDGQQIAKMLIPIAFSRFSPETGEDIGAGHWHFTCRHLTEDRKCGIYESRPGMCRNYPYSREHGHLCPHCGASDGTPEGDLMRMGIDVWHIRATIAQYEIVSETEQTEKLLAILPRPPAPA